jgi:hypothetical protein
MKHDPDAEMLDMLRLCLGGDPHGALDWLERQDGLTGARFANNLYEEMLRRFGTVRAPKQWQTFQTICAERELARRRGAETNRRAAG